MIDILNLETCLRVFLFHFKDNGTHQSDEIKCEIYVYLVKHNSDFHFIPFPFGLFTLLNS